MYELYYAKGTIAFSVLIALEEIGAEYYLQFVDFNRGEQMSDAYLNKNPKGRVPLLITPDGPVSETPAILTYLAGAHKDKNLAPAENYPYAKMQECLSYFASTFHVNHAHKFRGARWSDDEASYEAMRQKVPETMNASAAYVEEFLLQGPYVLGEYSLADMHLFAIANWFEVDGVDIAQYPKLHVWHETMNGREAVKRAIAKSEQR